MRTIKLGKSGVDVPVIAVGCMRMADKSVDEAKAFLNTAMDAGLNKLAAECYARAYAR